MIPIKYDFTDVIKDTKNTYRLLNTDFNCSDKHYLQTIELNPIQVKVYVVNNANQLKNIYILTQSMFHHWYGQKYMMSVKPIFVHTNPM